MAAETIIPDSRALRGGIIRRLAAVGFLLAVIGGTGTWFIEMKRADAAILSKLLEESRTMVVHLQHLGAVHHAEVAERADELTRGNFISVELYDSERRQIYKVARDWPFVGAKHGELEHKFPRDDEPHSRTYRANGRLLTQAMIPLWNDDGKLIGYLEGLYSLKPEDERAIRVGIAVSLGTVVLVVVATAAVLYPIILRLIAGQLQLSNTLLEASIQMMEVLGAAIAKRDSDTSDHNWRVTYYAIQLACRLGRSRDDICRLIVGSFLHDVGKIGIPDAILLKPGRHTRDEATVMRTHVRLGLDIIGRSAWLNMGADVVGSHHERYDGTGYPSGLAGEAIPLDARIFAVVDVFDALTSARPYKVAHELETALEMMATQESGHFDPVVLAAFVSGVPDWHAWTRHVPACELETAVRTLVRHYFRSSRWVSATRRASVLDVAHRA